MKLLRLVVVVVVVVGLLLRWLGFELGAVFLWVAGIAEAVLLVFVLTAVLRLWRRRRAAAADGSRPGGWEALRLGLRESLPAGVAEAVWSELRVFVAAMATLTLRPLRPRVTPGRTRFGSMGASLYGGTVATLVILLLIEAPAVHIVLGAVMDDGPVRSATRGVLLFSSIYLGVWLVGDLRLLKESAGVLVGHGRLEIDLGLRARGRVDLDDIVRAEVISENGDDEDDPDTTTPIRVTHISAPNARVWLRRPATIRGLIGIPLRGDRLDIFVDDPTGLVHKLRNPPNPERDARSELTDE